MTRLRLHLKSHFAMAASFLVALLLFQTLCISSARAQSAGRAGAAITSPASNGLSFTGEARPDDESNRSENLVALQTALPADPGAAEPGSGDPGASGANPEHPDLAASAKWDQPAFSRVGIGADVSPLGIGLKTAIVLNRFFDARVNGDFFHYNSRRFEIEGFNVDLNLQLASAGASLDWYPWNSIWRLSPGVLFFNNNEISGVLNIVPGSSFDLNGQTYYSGPASPANGTVPLSGNAQLGLHSVRPAATIAGGFGKFIPRSNRHWSFPSEFGVAFTGTPSINVNFAGTACVDAELTQCGNLSSTTNPVAVQFNSDLQSSLAKWRRTLHKIQVYPLLSYSVVYSFNIR